MTPAEMRAAIAEARSQEWDEEARPWLPCRVVRKRDPGCRRRIRVLPGVFGEVLATEHTFTAKLPQGARDGGFDVRPAVAVVCRVFCDDLERYLDRETGQ